VTAGRAHQIALHLGLAAGAGLVLLPFWLMLRTSFTLEARIFDGSLLLSDPTLENYVRVFAEVPVWRYYLNGLIVVGAILIGQIATCVPAAFALARWHFAGRDLGLWLVLLAIMVPFQATAIPIYVGLAWIGWIDSRGAMILPFVGSAFSVFLLRQFFLSLPSSVFDAARLDGAGPVRMLVNVVFPLARPAILTFCLFSFISHWNDYFWPSFVLRGDRAATVPFGIVSFLDREIGGDFGAQMAAATLTVLPLLFGFLMAQRQFVAGIALASGQTD